jgi:putative transposase
MYVIRGLSSCRAILGIDFIREQQLVLDSGSPFFKALPKEDSRNLAVLQATQDMVIPMRTIQRTELHVRTARGCSFPEGKSGVAAAAHDDLGIWDSLSTTNVMGNVPCIVSNISFEDKQYRKGDILGYFSPLSDSEVNKGLSEEKIDSIFSDFSKEPQEPLRGPCSTDMTEEERHFMNENLQIKSPLDFYDRYKDLCFKYHDCFSKSKFDIGRSDVVEHKINMKSEDPVHVRQFRIPLEHRQTIYDWVDELLAKGAIEVSRSCFNTPIFLVPKPHGHGMRAVLDFRQINDASVPDRYTIREVRDCVDEIGMAGSVIFSTIDLTSGFWQQSLEPGSRHYTAFTVPGKGTRYQWTVTPMGLQGSPASFARLIDYIMRGIREVLTYIDDILVHTRDHASHLESLEKVFLRLRKYGLKLNVAKSIFGASEVTYLGYKITPEGIQPGDEKLKAVSDFPAPNSVRKIREFVGLANYFRFLIPGFARQAGILTNLTKKDSSYSEGELPAHALSAFNYLKNKLVQSPVVAHPKSNCRYHLSTDAAAGDDLNPGGFGAVLTQLWPDGNERVIAYASRSLKQNEKNYSAYLLELAAAAWAIDHFSVYLLGKHFVLFTDHKPLETLSKTHKKTLNRLQEQMLEYDFSIRYKKGLENTAADALSRNAVEVLALDKFLDTMKDESGDVVKAQRSDPFIRDMIKFLTRGELQGHSPGYRSKIEKHSKDCFFDKDALWKTVRVTGQRDRTALVCPDSLKKQVMDVAHCAWTGGHCGRQRTVDRILLGYWWPGMHYDVDSFLAKCIRCQELGGRKPDPSPLQSLPLCEEPNFRVHMDLFGPLRTRSKSGAKYIIVITDAFSKYTELVAIVDKTAETVAKAFFESWICRHGVPRAIVSDRGKEFLNSVMKDLCELMGISHTPTSSYHPQSNAQAETYNKTMIRYLKSMLDNDCTLDWEEYLPMMMFSYNTHVHRATKESPFFLTYLHDPRLPYFNLEKPRKLYGEDYVSGAFSKMRLTFTHVRDNLKDARDQREQYFNRRTKDRVFKIGDMVLVKFPQLPVGVNPKFYKTWKGPYLVVKVLSRLNLRVVAESGSRKTIVVHVDRVKHMNLEDREHHFDSSAPESASAFLSKSSGKDIVNSPSDVVSKEIVSYFDPDDEFDQDVDSDTEADVGDEAVAPASPVVKVNSPRVTRAHARATGQEVEDFPLPDYCLASKRFTKCSGK